MKNPGNRYYSVGPAGGVVPLVTLPASSSRHVETSLVETSLWLAHFDRQPRSMPPVIAPRRENRLRYACGLLLMAAAILLAVGLPIATLTVTALKVTGVIW